MTDIERAKSLLNGHSIALCKGSEELTSEKRGIAPLMDFIERGVELKGWSAADKVVGKAAAMLFVYVGVKELYAAVLSESGASVLKKHGVSYTFGAMTERIINRKGDDICPMEKAASETDDPKEAVRLFALKLKELGKANQ